MFEALMVTYRTKAQAYRQLEPVRADEMQARADKMQGQIDMLKTQDDLEKAVGQKTSRNGKNQLKLLETQRKLVLERQKLELEKQAVQSLLEGGEGHAIAQDDGVDPESLQRRLAEIQAELAVIDRSRRDRTLGVLEDQTKKFGKVKAVPRDITTMNKGMLIQERDLLRADKLLDKLADESNLDKDCGPSIVAMRDLLASATLLTQAVIRGANGGDGGSLPFLRGSAAKQEADLEAAQQTMLQLTETVSELGARWRALALIEDAEARRAQHQTLLIDVAEGGAKVKACLRTVQDRTQDVMSQVAREQHLAALPAQSMRRLRVLLEMPGSERQHLSPGLQDLLADPLSEELRPLLLADTSYEGGREQASGEVRVHLDKLKRWADNDVVQGPFLIGADNQLVQASTQGGDLDFIQNNSAAKDDYNRLENLGKFIYHVTALSNLLQFNGLDATGISRQGLQPKQAGRRGGASLSAESVAVVPGTDVSMRDASVANSQNKVAASSNRKDAMRVYIKQGEGQVSDHMRSAASTDNVQDSDQSRRDAALRTPVMLRFPIRVEYLGKFDQDPIHMASNLHLLDGTPVPPTDIECLVHQQWVGITDEAFLGTLAEIVAQ